MLLNSDIEALWCILQTLTCVSSCLQNEQEERQEPRVNEYHRSKSSWRNCFNYYYCIIELFILSSLGDKWSIECEDVLSLPLYYKYELYCNLAWPSLYFIQLYLLLLCHWIVVLCSNSFVLVLNEDTLIIKNCHNGYFSWSLLCFFVLSQNIATLVSFPELFTMKWSSHKK